MSKSTSPNASLHTAPRDLRSPETTASSEAAVINRTHRVVRERAQLLQARRTRDRTLWIPLVVCAALVVMCSHAFWSLLDQYEISPSGIPDASDQMLVFLLWFLPVTAALLAAVWFRKTRPRVSSETLR